METERRSLSRRAFSYYMRVTDDASGEFIGHLADISASGFKLDSKKSLPLNMVFKMRIEQTEEISNKSFVVFTARVKWRRRDEYDISLYNVGFQLVNISQTDYDVFMKMFNMYGAQKNSPENGITSWS